LSEYLDGRLGAAELRRVRIHLSTCRRCRDDLREMEILKRVVRRVPVPEPRDGFWEDTLQTVRVRRQRPVARASYRYALGVAAGIVLVGIMLMSRPYQPIPSPRATMPEITINPASLISLHARERARSPLADIGKVRFAGSEADAADLADNGRFDIE